MASTRTCRVDALFWTARLLAGLIRRPPRESTIHLSPPQALVSTFGLDIVRILFINILNDRI
jgi:hypothetical protein